MKTVRHTGTKGNVVARPTLYARIVALLLLLLLPFAAYAERFLVLWANHKGSEGTVKIGSNAIAEIKGWEINESANTIDDTELSDSAETHQVGTTSWTASVDCYWDETDTNGQMAMTIGASVTLNLYPEGATSADTYYTGTATVVGIGRAAAINGMVGANYQLKGTGALTKGTVV